MTAAANLLPMAAGVLLLGERTAARRARALALRVGAFAAAVAGAWALAGHAAPPAVDDVPAEPALWLQPSLPTAAR